MKWIFLFIIFSYTIFFILTLPAQTPDELGHYETVYWTSKGVYPFLNLTFHKDAHSYGSSVGSLFNLGNENPNRIVNFQRIKNDQTIRQFKYNSEEEKLFISETDQAYNPPFYYYTGGVILTIARTLRVSFLGQFYAVRLVSGIFYILSVIVFYRITCIIFSTEKQKRDAVLFFALNPLFIQSGIGISPDIAVQFFSILCLWMVINALQRNTIWNRTVLIKLGVVTGLASVTKITGIVLFPSVILLLWLNKHTIQTWMRSALYIGIPFGVIQAPWYLLNVIRYHRPVVETIAFGLVESSTYSISIVRAGIETFLNFRHTFMHYAGFLGQNDVFPIPPVFFLYTALFIGLMGIGIYSYLRNRQQMGIYIVGHMMFLLLFFFVLGFMRKMYFHPGWEIGGRNILQMYPEMVLCITAGATYLSEKIMKKNIPFLSLFSISYFYFIVLSVLIPRYYV